ncbi:hypothetical protein Dimus_025581 [Dionaea muscipula]
MACCFGVPGEGGVLDQGHAVFGVLLLCQELMCGFPGKVVCWIKVMLYSVSFSFMLNGEIIGFLRGCLEGSADLEGFVTTLDASRLASLDSVLQTTLYCQSS